MKVNKLIQLFEVKKKFNNYIKDVSKYLELIIDAEPYTTEYSPKIVTDYSKYSPGLFVKTYSKKFLIKDTFDDAYWERNRNPSLFYIFKIHFKNNATVTVKFELDGSIHSYSGDLFIIKDFEDRLIRGEFKNIFHDLLRFNKNNIETPKNVKPKVEID